MASVSIRSADIAAEMGALVGTGEGSRDGVAGNARFQDTIRRKSASPSASWAITSRPVCVAKHGAVWLRNCIANVNGMGSRKERLPNKGSPVLFGSSAYSPVIGT
jgi:hypothetical protein